MKANSFVYDRLRLHLLLILSLSVIYVNYLMWVEIVILFIYLFILIFSRMYNKKCAKTSRLARKFNYTKNSIILLTMYAKNCVALLHVWLLDVIVIPDAYTLGAGSNCRLSASASWPNW